MKKFLFICLLFLSVFTFTVKAQIAQKAITSDVSLVNRTALMSDLKPLSLVRGANSFSTLFNRNTTARHDMNAYLLSYITTLIYPQYLSIAAENAKESYIDQLHSNSVLFETEYKKYTAFLFGGSPQYRFITASNPLGYDPEAMVISTNDVVYVVFRGTDRVATNSKSNLVSSFMYDWGEWITTDFDARLITAPGMTGKIHAGFWNSLNYDNFKGKLLQEIINQGGKTKKVWVMGHSLGSAHAQVFAMFMAKQGVTAHSLYLLAAPHPGDQAFVTELNRLYPTTRHQRFDFSSDPITALAPYTLGYKRAGTRVFYKDILSIQFGAPERSEAEVASLFSGILGAATNAIGISKFSITGSQICYHHPTWYLRAAYNQLSKDDKAKVPPPLPIPDATTTNGYSEACDALSINKGKNAGAPGSLIEQGLVAIEAGLETLKFVASTIISNVNGTAITEGDYYIKSYPTNGKLGIKATEGMTNGGSLRLRTSPDVVKIQRHGAVGYTIRFGTKTVSGLLGNELKEYVLDSDAMDLFDNGATTVHLWEKNGVPAVSANQRWLFIKVKDNKYILKNLANGKLLDANNSCLNGTDCGVKTWNPITDDQTQIWILEKK